MVTHRPFIIQDPDGDLRLAEIDPNLVSSWLDWQVSTRLDRLRHELFTCLNPEQLVNRTRAQVRRHLKEASGQVLENLTVFSVMKMADEVGFNERMMLQDVFQALHEATEGDFEALSVDIRAFIARIEGRLLALPNTELLAHAHLDPVNVMSLYEQKILRKGDFTQLAAYLEECGIDFVPYSTREALPDGFLPSWKGIEPAVEAGVFDDIMAYIRRGFEEGKQELSWEDFQCDVIKAAVSQIQVLLRRHEMDDWEGAQETFVSETINQLLWGCYIYREVSGKEYVVEVFQAAVLFLRRLWKRIINEKYPQYR